MNLKELYQEIILEHGKNPRNLGKTDSFNKDAKGHNPLCGDNVHIYLKLNGQKIVEEISFEGSGLCYFNGICIYYDRLNQR
jgi:nitrogen fixation NifU-like protein